MNREEEFAKYGLKPTGRTIEYNGELRKEYIVTDPRCPATIIQSGDLIKVGRNFVKVSEEK